MRSLKNAIVSEVLMLVRGDMETIGQRRPRREEVRELILERLLKGELAPGSRVKEVWLANELGVSRTPLREALFRLEQEGFVRADPARGFTVVPLTAREVREIYPIIWTLECLALRTAGLVHAEQCAELERLNVELAEEAEASQRRIELDTRWHRTLLQHCPNGRLLRLIDAQKQVAYRYEWAFMRETEVIPVSVQQHAEIIEALRQQDLERAVEVLELNWRSGMGMLLQRLDWL
ncbi:DNA-binding GntR family transcriptional regulator [Thermosporothrix hazakensis]|uniref:DNA-binding GntR family transcriptional regulator n=2 Tax=Thermosporothrix hazakensis TaxID=644383 RepID=A0A326U0V5_THEHA|nr:DNA-binding GntR family transcriptional regulator [Thermosporothrix hazakensis]